MNDLDQKNDVTLLNLLRMFSAYLLSMNPGRFILSQILDLVHRQTLDRLVKRYDAESRVRWLAMLYKMRWRIELFFRWIQQHLRIKHFYDTSPNAVKTQIWIAVATYLMVAIIHKQKKLPGTFHRTLQLLSVHPFEKVTLNELLTESDHRTLDDPDCNQLNLFEL